jgi:hypothetical protein
VSCRRGVHTRTTCPNLQLKLHKKIRAKKKNKQTKRKEVQKMTNGNIQTLAMNSWVRVYVRREPIASSESNIGCTMFTFFMRASVLSAFEDVVFVSKNAAFLLRGRKKCYCEKE